MLAASHTRTRARARTHTHTQVYNFYPILAASLFDTEGPAIEFQLNGKWEKPYNDFQVMMSRMYERQWCPSV